MGLEYFPYIILNVQNLIATSDQDKVVAFSKLQKEEKSTSSSGISNSIFQSLLQSNFFLIKSKTCSLWVFLF